MTRTLAVLAALRLAVGAAGRAEAGPIFTDTFTTDFAAAGSPISGSFQVDSSHIGAAGDTDISSFITNLTFTGGGRTFTAPTSVPSPCRSPPRAISPRRPAPAPTPADSRGLIRRMLFS